MAKIIVLLSADEGGTTWKQFQLLKQVCETVFTQVDFGTRDGLAPKFDETKEHSLKVIDYKQIDLIQNEYQGLVIPDGLGYYKDQTKELGNLLASFVKFKSVDI